MLPVTLNNPVVPLRPGDRGAKPDLLVWRLLVQNEGTNTGGDDVQYTGLQYKPLASLHTQQWNAVTHIILPLKIRRILLRRPLNLVQQRIEIMLRVLVVLRIRQRSRLCDVDCCSGDIVRLRLGSGRVRRFGVDAFARSWRGVEALAKGRLSRDGSSW